MAPSSPTSVVVTIAFVALIAWRLFARVRGSLARQRLTPVRPWVTVCFYALLLVLLLMSPAVRAAALWLVLPLVLGGALGIYGLRETKFEATESGLFYTPAMHLGIALSALLVARLLYRYIQMSGSGGAGATPPAAMASNPPTLAILGALAGYYATYAVGLILWQRRSSGSRGP